MAAGSYGDLAVVVSDNSLVPVTNRFLASFNPEKTFVIRPEPTFNADLLTSQQWDLAKGYKNSIFIIRIGDGGPAEKAAKKMLSSDAWQQLLSGNGGIVQLKDPWSTYQLAIVVAARDRNVLASILHNNADHIRKLIETSNTERMLRYNRYAGLQSALMNDYWRRFGFYMEIPKVYEQNQLKQDDYAGIELLQKAPSRGLSISWIKVDDPTAFLAKQTELALMRTAMGEKLHNEEIVPESFVWNEAVIDGKLCVKLEGAWNSNVFAGGGAFWCYFIPDHKRGLIYCVDALVYAPGLEKMIYFRQMDAIVSTFTTEQPQP